LRNENAIHERFEKVQECFGDISSIIQENLNGIRVIKGFGREDTQINRVREEGEKYVQLNRQLAKIQTFMGPALDLIMSLGMLLLLFFGGRSLIQDGERLITLGTFVAFQRYIQKMIWPMTAVGMAVSYYQRSISSSDRLKNIFSVSTDVPSPLNSAPLSPKTQGKIEFRNLTFKFPDSGFSAREKLTLSGINLVVEPGERVAFVGAIGAGKSAILALVPRLYPVQNGMLWIDGVDINHWPIQELRKRVGYVGQDVFLFSESIFENIAFGLHEQVLQGGAQTMVEQAAGIACVHDEIRGLPWGYQTRLGERGLNLSGGQKQRLTIARALAKQPPILVLDDALSSVDVHTEEKILQSLKVRSGKNTELISSHRISTIQNADQIVVLREGRVVQKGTHAQLMQFRGGEYWRFYEQQQLKEDLENYQNDLH